MQINNKFITPLITIALLVVGFIQVANSDGVFSQLEKWQLASLLVGAVVTYYVPLTKGRWPAILKVGGAVLGAVLAAVITAVASGSLFDGTLLTIVILAGLNAFAAQTGTDARVDAAKIAISDPDQSTKTAIAVDPSAANIAIRQLEKNSATIWSNPNLGQHIAR